MGIYYPQGIMQLRIKLEDFGDKTDPKLKELQVFSVVCRRIRVQQNSYQEADTFDAEVDFKNFPFDPRSIRSVGVSIFVEDKKKVFKTSNALNLLLPSEGNIIFQGFADEDNINLSEETRTVRLEGRDFTSFFLDQEYLEGPVSTSKPLDKILKDLINQVPGAETITIDNQTGAKILPTLAEFNESRDSEDGNKNSRPKKKYWDIMQDLIAQAGLIGFISIDKLVLSKPRALYSKRKAKLFIYGENLTELSFSRKLGRRKSTNIRVLSLNLKKKKVIEARIPKQATEAWAKDIGIPRENVKIPVINADGTKNEKDKEAPFLTFRIPNVVDFNHIVSIGEKIFEEIGRQEIEGALTTKEMVVCEKGSEAFFDSTKFRIGTPIEIGIDQGDMEGLPKLLEKDPKKKINPKVRINTIKKFLIKNCYDPKVAGALAISLVKLSPTFFTKAVEFSLDQESGWTMKIDFINFIELPKNLADRVSNA